MEWHGRGKMLQYYRYYSVDCICSGRMAADFWLGVEAERLLTRELPAINCRSHFVASFLLATLSQA